MRTTIVIILMLLFTNNTIFSQSVTHVKTKDYEGYIFPKESHIWGFPPTIDRYTLSSIDIVKAERIIQSNKIYIFKKLMFRNCGRNKAKKFLNKYIRQYVGYVKDDGHIIVNVFFTRQGTVEKHKYKDDIISVCDGGTDTWRIVVDLIDQTIIELSTNGNA